MTKISRSLILGCSIAALAACGPEEIASPGTGGNVTINEGDVITNNPAPTPTPTPTPTQTLVTPAAGCPTIAATNSLVDEGTITGPEGTWRVCKLPNVFDISSTLRFIPGLLYRMDGRTDVGTDGGATDTGNDSDIELTIEPGVIIYASGRSFLNVNRGNSIDANGTAMRPIIMTSRDNVLGINTETSSGQWGGLILSGRAPITDCRLPNATPGTAACERQVEGESDPALYGGDDATDSSGSVSYLQLRFSGVSLTPDNELQSLTTGGTGSGTDMGFIQSVNSADDGVEFFGGVVNMKHLIVIGAEDDSLDTDTGVQANLQYVIVAQRAGAGERMVEADSNNGLEDQTPAQVTNLVNATMIQRNRDGSDAAFRLRGKSNYRIANSVFVNEADAIGFRIDFPEGIARTDFQSLAVSGTTDIGRDGSGGITAQQVVDKINSGTGNNLSFVSTLTGVINGANETGFTPIYDAATELGSFFDTTTYIGAVEPADTWWQGWTCTSAAAAFPGGTGDCTAIPVFN